MADKKKQEEQKREDKQLGEELERKRDRSFVESRRESVQKMERPEPWPDPPKDDYDD